MKTSIQTGNSRLAGWWPSLWWKIITPIKKVYFLIFALIAFLAMQIVCNGYEGTDSLSSWFIPLVFGCMLGIQLPQAISINSSNPKVGDLYAGLNLPVSLRQKHQVLSLGLMFLVLAIEFGASLLWRGNLNSLNWLRIAYLILPLLLISITIWGFDHFRLRRQMRPAAYQVLTAQKSNNLVKQSKAISLKRALIIRPALLVSLIYYSVLFLLAASLNLLAKQTFNAQIYYVVFGSVMLAISATYNGFTISHWVAFQGKREEFVRTLGLYSGLGALLGSSAFMGAMLALNHWVAPVISLQDGVLSCINFLVINGLLISLGLVAGQLIRGVSHLVIGTVLFVLIVGFVIPLLVWNNLVEGTNQIYWLIGMLLTALVIWGFCVLVLMPALVRRADLSQKTLGEYCNSHF